MQFQHARFKRQSSCLTMFLLTGLISFGWLGQTVFGQAGETPDHLPKAGGPHDREYQNIKVAIEFVREVNPKIADQLQDFLDKGKIRVWDETVIHVDRETKARLLIHGEYKDGTIYLSKQRVHQQDMDWLRKWHAPEVRSGKSTQKDLDNMLARIRSGQGTGEEERPFESPLTYDQTKTGATDLGYENTRRVAALASTLVHELVHHWQMEDDPIYNMIFDVGLFLKIVGESEHSKVYEVPAHSQATRYGKKYLELFEKEYQRDRAEYTRFLYLRELTRRMVSGETWSNDEVVPDLQAHPEFYPPELAELAARYERGEKLDDNAKATLLTYLLSELEEQTTDVSRLIHFIEAMRALKKQQSRNAQALAAHEEKDKVKLVDKLEDYFERTDKEINTRKGNASVREERLDNLREVLTNQITKRTGTAPAPNATGLFIDQGTVATGGAVLVSGAAAVQPGSTVEIRSPSGKTVTVKADEFGRFVLPLDGLDKRGIDIRSAENEIRQTTPDGKTSEPTKFGKTPATTRFGQALTAFHDKRELGSRQPPQTPAGQLAGQPQAGRWASTLAAQLDQKAFYLAEHGSSEDLRQLASTIDTETERLKTKQQGLNPAEDPGYQLLDSQIGELTALSGKVNKVLQAGNDLKQRLVADSKAAGGNAAGVVDTLVGRTTTAEKIAEGWLWDGTDGSWYSIYQAMVPRIIAEAARSVAPASGDDVAKGGVVIDQESGAPVPGVTLKLTLNEEIVTTKTAEDGTFEVKVPESTVVQGRVASPGTDSPPLLGGVDLQVDQADPVLAQSAQQGTVSTERFLEKLRELPEAKQQQVIETVLLTDFLGEDSSLAQDLTTAPPAVRAAMVTRGLNRLTVLLKRPVTLEDIEAIGEGLRTRLGKTPEALETLDKLAKSFSAGVPEVIAKNKRLTVTTQPSTTRIAIDSTEELTGDQTFRLINQLQTIGPENYRVTITSSDIHRVTESISSDGKPAETVSSVTILSIRVLDADGKSVQLESEKLQQFLDKWAEGEPNVRFAEAALPREAEASPPNDPYFSARGSWGQEYQDQWAMQRIGFDVARKSAAWNALDKRKSRVIVAVLGSGVDWTHPELLNQVWLNMDEDPANGVDDDGNGLVDDFFGWNFRDDSKDVMDHGGHDSHVAGVIAARSNNKFGIAGINPHARIMSLKVANFTGQADSINISRAIFYAVDSGARVINISYGGAKPSRIEQRAIDYAVSNNVLVVVAAGNKSSDASKYALASCQGVLTVAGTTVKDTRAPFSNWGQAVDLSAPAMDVLGLRARDTDFLLYTGDSPDYDSGSGILGEGENFYRASGTSFAAPLVAGAASLLRSSRPELSAQQVKQMLIMSAQDVETPGWDQFTGSGVLSIAQAVTADPDYFLFAQISQVKAVRKENKISIQVLGKASGSSLAKHQLQVGFGASPADSDWMTVSTGEKAVSDGRLGILPLTRFNRKGVWTIRLLVTDKQGKSRQARATLNLN